jgi:hypothetical protein
MDQRIHPECVQGVGIELGWRVGANDLMAPLTPLDTTLVHQFGVCGVFFVAGTGLGDLVG